MKIIKEQAATRNRGVRVTVELEEGENLMAFNSRDYYLLGGQLNDIVQGHVINESKRVRWSSIMQEWVRWGSNAQHQQEVANDDKDKQ